MNNKALRILAILFVMPVPAFSQVAPPKLRLPADVQPVAFRLDLTVLPAQEDFSGVVDADVRFAKETDIIWLNATDLTIHSATLTAGGVSHEGEIVPGGTDFVGLRFPKAFEPGAARLEIKYQGKINSQSSEGLFRNKVGDDWYAFTQFEAVSARRAFPSFDEPAYKIPWQVTLRVKKEHLALANTPVVSEIDAGEGMKTVTFARTKPLPSYLVAFAVGPFEIVDAGKAGRSGTPLRIITPRGKTAQARYAVESTGVVLGLLEDYFGTPYPYEKLDQVAVPLFGGAMENPGLVTYGDTLMLADPAHDSIERQRNYVALAAHELAHQWFGDLVTMKWWDDTWLNEAFASWMGDKIADRFQPAWKTRVGSMGSRSGAMAEDSLLAARRIRQPIESNDDIANAFDGITYEKGAAVIGMFEQWVGEEDFRKGVRAYLDKFSSSNATADDFLTCIDTVSGKSVKRAFSTFLDQPGVPLVSVDLQCGGAQPELLIDQARSLPIGSHGSTSETWQIPMCVAYDEGGGRKRECTLVQQKRITWRLSEARACPKWLLANDGELGYYRTLYAGDLLQRLLADRGSKLTETERVGVVREIRDLAKGGQLPMQTALRVIPEFISDESRFVVTSLVQIASDADDHVSAELAPNFARFVQHVFGPKAHELGWTTRSDESEDTRLLRLSLVPFVAQEGDDAELRLEARDLAVRWLSDRSAVPADLVGAVLNTAASGGDRVLYEQLLAAARQTTEPREAEWLLGALGSFRDPEIVRSALGLLLVDDFDLRQSMVVLFAPLGHRETRELPYRWVEQNYDALRARFPAFAMFNLGAFLPFTGTGFCDERGADEVESFYRDKMAGLTGGPRNLAKAAETIRLCGAARKAHQAGIAEFLSAY